MAEKKKAMVALQGYPHECELVEVVNKTAVILMRGYRTMTSVDFVTPVNAAAKKMLEPAEDKPEPKKKEPAKDKPEPKKKKEPLKKRPAAKKKKAVEPEK